MNQVHTLQTYMHSNLRNYFGDMGIAQRRWRGGGGVLSGFLVRDVPLGL